MTVLPAANVRMTSTRIAIADARMPNARMTNARTTVLPGS
jgi:hypothetical protein